MLTPTFHFNILRDFVEVFVEESEKLVKSIKEKGGETVEHVNHLSEIYTLNSICGRSRRVNFEQQSIQFSHFKTEDIFFYILEMKSFHVQLKFFLFQF